MKDPRPIQQRWYVTGRLELLTPTSLSNGDEDPTVDLPVVLDPLEGRALLVGASLAGALRNYLNEYSGGYEDDGSQEKENSLAVALFGSRRGDTKEEDRPDRSEEGKDPSKPKRGEQSRLIVEDALGSPGRGRGRPEIELRDGVRIDPKTRTADDQKKYDRQLLAAGTTFEVGFEVIVTADDDVNQLKKGLFLALAALQDGAIHLGGRKRRGYGRCQVSQWQAWAYDLRQPAGIYAWLAHNQTERPWHRYQQASWQGLDIRDWPLLAGVEQGKDQRQYAEITANFELDGSLLVRAGFEQERGPDTAHLESRRGRQMVPVLPGTSLAGVMRAQAARIARTISRDEDTAEAMINQLFGYMPEGGGGAKAASRVTVEESEITGNYHKLVQSRVRIDRFTGGAFASALFAEQPIFGGEVEVAMRIKKPTKAEIGLLLLVFKDLWTGLTPVGGEAAIGRGRLAGQWLTLTWQGPTGCHQWKLALEGGRLTLKDGDAAGLNDFVKQLTDALQRGAS